MDAFLDLLIQLLIDWGYVGLFISSFLAGSIIPFSSEVVMAATLGVMSYLPKIYAKSDISPSERIAIEMKNAANQKSDDKNTAEEIKDNKDSSQEVAFKGVHCVFCYRGF